VTALERKALISKQADASDGRAVALKATPKGGRVAQSWPSSFAPIVAGLSETEQEALLGLVVKMIRQLQQRRLIAPQRTCVRASAAVIRRTGWSAITRPPPVSIATSRRRHRTIPSARCLTERQPWIGHY
jgi:hypothetical protein